MAAVQNTAAPVQQNNDQPNIRVLEDAEILAQVFDEHEIENYAEDIGINIELDRDLFWIAVDGLRAVPPKPWKACFVEDGQDDIFFFNFRTGESVWDHPCDDMFREKVKEEMEKRVLVPLTLHLTQTEKGYLAAGVNLAGNVLCEAEVKDSSVTFGDVRDALMANLTLPEGTVPRFVLADCTVLGHSFRSKTVSELFGLA